MEKLVNSERWQDRWWRNELDKESRLLAVWLWDHADTAGFVDFDMEDYIEDSGTTLDKGIEALGRLCKPCKGYTRVYKGSGDSPEKVWLWLRNYVKCQQKTMDLSPKEGKKGQSWPRVNIARRFVEMEERFPEVKAYEGYTRVAKGSTTLVKASIPSIRANRKEHNITSNTEEYPEETGDVQYDKLGAEGLKLKWESWLELKKKWPDHDMDWEATVDYIIGCHVNSARDGVDDVWKFATNLGMKGKFRKKQVAGAAPAAESKEGRIAAVELEYEDGDIDADECKVKIAAIEAEE